MKHFPHTPTDAELASAIGADYHSAIAKISSNSNKNKKSEIFRDICDQYMIHRKDYTSVDQLIADIQFVWKQNKKQKKAGTKKLTKKNQYKIQFPTN